MIVDAMENGTTRVRFAPSPTGLLHVGNARTALFNWLFARSMGGKFILRIEDTDVQGSKQSFEKQLLDDLVWLGLTWDEGPNENDPGEKGEFGPYHQSKRLNIYTQHTAQLLAEGKAYRCFCTQEELEAERTKAAVQNRPQVYSGKCRNLSKAEVKENLLRGKWYSVRLKIPNHVVRFHDVVRGDLQFAPETIGDPILVRSAQGGTAGASPGVPVYNYVVTVDDALMGITHVIRGDDHISNTPRQVAIYEAFGWKVPQFAHLPAILGSDRERLSKRHGPTAISNFREMGYLPEAIVNQLALLGWSPVEKAETFNIEQLVHAFSLDRVAQSAAILDFEKLDGLNRHYIENSQPSRIASLCWDYFGGYLPAKEAASDALLIWFFHMVSLFVPHVSHLDEVAAKAAFIFHTDPDLARADEENAEVLAVDSAHLVLTELANRVRAHTGPMGGSELSKWMKEIQTITGAKGDELYDPVRIALTGSLSGPDLDKLVPVLESGAVLNLGILNVRQRLDQFIGI
jgi:nondiscriminating glutamyl-tRNA synthetase